MECSQWRREAVPFASMVGVECMIVGGNTLYKSATATAPALKTSVFVFYVYFIALIFLLPSPFILYRRTSNIPPMKISVVVEIFLISIVMYFCQMFGFIGVKYSSPTLSSIMNSLSPAFTFIIAFIFRMEKINLKNHASQAKILGTVVSIAGALIATLYNGQPPLSNSANLDWIIGGIFLVTQYLLLSFVLIAQAHVLSLYPVDLMVLFVSNLTGVIVALLGGLVMARDLNDWKLKPNAVSVAMLYVGFATGFLCVLIQYWNLRLKGPLYIAMFRPLSILIAIAMGVIFLGESLHIESIVGGAIISLGFYAVLWGMVKEGIRLIKTTPSSSTQTIPLLRDHVDLEQAGAASEASKESNHTGP